MSTEHPSTTEVRSDKDTFVNELRTNLNAFNAKHEERVNKARKARRKARRNRIVGYAVAIVVGLGVGTAIVTAQQADAASQTQINRFIRSEGGIPPCTHEDGSGQRGTCVWWAKKRGNGKGYSYLAVDRKGKDDALIYINGPKAKRY